MLVVTDRADDACQERLRDAGATILHEEGDDIPLVRLLPRLYGMGVDTLLVEGGGQTIWRFIHEGIFDQIILTVSPLIAGGGGTSLVEGEGFARLSDGPALRLKSVQRYGEEVVLRYVRYG